MVRKTSSVPAARVAFLGGGLLLSVLLAPVASLAQTRNAGDGVYTAGQVGRGDTLFQANCSACHGGSLQGGEGPPLTGQDFLKTWQDRPLAALYDFINTQMPLGQPGMLGAQGTADVIALILSANKYPAGQAELPPGKPPAEILFNKRRMFRRNRMAGGKQ